MLGLDLSLIGQAVLARSHPSAVPAPPAPPAALAYLPALGTAGAGYHLVISNERLLQAYGGALLSAGGDLGTGRTAVGAGEVQVARGTGEALRVAGWYDQSGRGHHAIAATAAEMPALREDVRIGDALAIAFDGIRSGDGRGAQSRRITAATALDAGNCTLACVIDPTVSVQEQYYWELRNAANNATAIGHFQHPGSRFGGALPDNHGNIKVNNRDCGRKIATVPQVMLVRVRGGSMDVFLDGTKIAALPAPAGAAGPLSIGHAGDGSGLDAFIPTFRLGAFVAVDRGVDDPDVAAITGALAARFAIPTSYEAVVVNIGSSRVAGMSRSTCTRNKAWFERANYGTRRIRTYNLGQDGKAISGCFADRAVFDAELYRPDMPVVYVIDDPINDLGGLGASTDPGTIYTTYAQYRAALTALGPNVRVVTATCMPQASGAYGAFGRPDAAVETDRRTLNALIAGNTAGANAVADPAAVPAMGTYPDSATDATLYGDRLHPTSRGYALVAGTNPAAVLGVL